MEILGTKKITYDRVNEPIRLMGFKSTTLVIVVFGGLLLGGIGLLLINLGVGLALIISYTFVIIRLANWLKENQKKGIENPISDKLEYLSINKYYNNSIDFKELYHEQQRSIGSDTI